MGHSQKILFFLFALHSWTKTNAILDPPFPTMDKILFEFSQTEVKVTDENQDATAFATEYYDQSENRGRLDIMEFGEKLSLYYYNMTGDILEVNSTSCIAWPEDISDYYYQDTFFGWLNKDPLIIGPSALLWFAQPLKPVYQRAEKPEYVRGIACDHWKLTVFGPNEKMDYDYFFAVESWTTPYQLPNKRVPIRIALNGESARETNKKELLPINQVIDFMYYKPTIPQNSIQPPVGLGCFGRVSDLMKPNVPKEFRYSAEIIDLLAAENNIEMSAVFERVWYMEYTRLARLDAYKQDSMKSNIYDFNNGVIYSVENGQTCAIKPLRNSIFEADDRLMGFFKNAEQFLGYDGDFYYMGTELVRGINCRIFERATRHESYEDTEYYLLVTTIYFTDPYTSSAMQGENLHNAPVQILITGYDKPNNLALKKQYSILGFNDVVGSSIFEGFDVEDCFPLSSQKTYFMIDLDVDQKTTQTLEGNDELFIDEVTSAIMLATNLSALRLPNIKADYTEDGVAVNGVILDRPPFLAQFWLYPSVGPVKADGLKQIDGANTREKCAFSCIDDPEFTCWGFHFCNNLCYINSRSIVDERIDADTKDLGVCEIFLRSESGTTTKDPYLTVAVDKLLAATLQVDIPLDDDNDLNIFLNNIIVGQGPYNRKVTDKSYKVVHAGYQLSTTVTTTVDRSDRSSENSCYTACKGDTTIGCQSFSYCPDADNHQCRISSAVLSSDNTRDLESNKLCNVYSLLNLDFFEPSPGKVLLQPETGDVFEKVSPEECALKCRMKKSYTCRGFEHCAKDNNCVLHKKHILDFQPGELVDTTEKCTHYSASFIADYLDMGLTLIDDSSNERTDLTVQECARVCSEEVSDCKSFMYCPSPDGENGPGTKCSLTSKTLSDTGVKTKDEENSCRLYTKRDDVESYGLRSRRPTTTPGYTKGGFYGMVIGTLIFGLVVGIGAFVGYSYYRSRKYNDGMSVRFVKQNS